ncbi:MAG: hypothetical protein AAF611_09735 [Bacteroidota bacterium]
MKKILPLLAMLICVISCSNDETIENLIGTWQLAAVLLDIGDGNDEFRSINSDNILIFSTNGETVTSNESFCNLNEQFSAIYSEETGIITVNDCSEEPFFINFEIQGPELILSYPCFEACLYKYVKR